jgi:Flp pilus assembly protein TadG
VAIRRSNGDGYGPRLMAPIRHRGAGGGDRGAALVEFALALPLLLVVIAGIVDFAFVFQRYEVITNAAREGARLASLPEYTDDALVRARVRSYVQNGLSLSPGALNSVMPVSPDAVSVTHGTFTVPKPGGTTEDVDSTTVTVNYQHNFLLLGPMLSLINGSWGGTITLTSSSQMRLETSVGAGS